MSETLKISSIGKNLEAVIDYRGHTPPKAPSGIPVLTAANVKHGRIDLSDLKYVSKETYKQWTTRGFPEPGDVLITTEAPIGEVATFPGDQTYLITRRLIALRGQKEVLDNQFLKYSLLFSGNRDRLLSSVRGSTVPRVLKPDILNLEIWIPPLPEQKAIAHILGSLDDKIELNRRMNETLEEMARAIFKDWFIDFGPTRAKMEGRDPYLPDPLWSLFPDAMDPESGLPEGWEEESLDKVADFLNGLALQKYPPSEDEDSLPVIKIAELRSGIITKSGRASRRIPEKYIVKDGDFLFSWSGSLVAKFWTEGEGALNQHLFKVTSTDYPIWFFTQWTYHHLEGFQQIAAAKATTMGHIQRGHLTAATDSICLAHPDIPDLRDRGQGGNQGNASGKPANEDFPFLLQLAFPSWHRPS
ncbi:MAG: restriction endonuclease subunit S [Synechococcaceae cyanobacterium SM2_3_2]|nr:restriction endonuclease subunit S [Synechococcaceae cyanobacterium SM2_3_2]